MIGQDYAELLGTSPPSGDVLEWTFSTRTLASAFSWLLLGTPALCVGLFFVVSESQEDPSGYPLDGAELRIPTLTRLGIQSPVGEVLTAGFHLAAVLAIGLFWCVRLSHHQRLQARTGVSRYDLQAEGAIRWVKAAWVMGSLGAVFLFVGASVKGDTEATFSAQGIAHLALFVAAATGFLGQAACTAWALRKARRVFVVSDADLVSYRRKMFIVTLMVIAMVSAIASVLLLERFVDNAWVHDDAKDMSSRNSSSSGSGVTDTTTAMDTALTAITPAIATSGPTAQAKPDRNIIRSRSGTNRDCDTEWCYSRSALALWECVLLLLEAFFCLALKHDLATATGGVGVESFVL